MKRLSISIICFAFCLSVWGQSGFRTWIPGPADVQGRGWSTGLASTYDRLPASAESRVRKEVWNLSRHAAGLYLRFRTNAAELLVNYTVQGPVQMPHMPATGVSGVDLYVKQANGTWDWAAGRYRFGDTIRFSFGALGTTVEREFVLYLPLYNHVNWLEMSYPGRASFTPLPAEADKPVVVYGTSIAHGACASRPGLGWTNILSRLMGMPLVNLAFSGNGRLEPEVYGYVGEIDASVFVLDCLPNMSGDAYIKEGILRRRLDSAYRYLRAKHPQTPILFTEHAGYGDEGTNAWKMKTYQAANAVLQSFYRDLRKSGAKQIGYLSRKDIGLGIESTVDGIHPNDIGMMEYAKAYTRKLRELLRK